MSTTTDQQPSSAETPSTTSSREMQYWVPSRRGPVELAAFSNPPHNYLTKGVIDELEQLVVEWRDPSIRAVVIQSHDQDAGFFTQYSVEELDGLASDPALFREGRRADVRWRHQIARSRAGPGAQWDA